MWRKEADILTPTPGAIDARGSSEQPAAAQTSASQVAALRERVAAEGLVVPEAMQLLDDGSSGAPLMRPALERLRDGIAAGAVDRVDVHSPDRLARTYAYQVVLVEECRRAGVEGIFLKRALGQSPEDALLLQVQGMIAEYERATILDRHRRGKRHAARAGAVHVLRGAPYGYRYVAQ
jgi:site-specific DNA recombinase